jgi:phosphoserine phosphatase
MVQIVLIRPGATDYDQQGRIQGNLEVPLSADGASEVARMVEELRGQKIEILYTAHGQPAEETAETIAEALQIKLKKVDRLENLDFGLWQGLIIDDVRVKQPKIYRQWQEMPYNVCPPEGEMLADAEERVRAVLTKLLKRHREGVIGLVIAEPLASVARHSLTQTELGDLWKAVLEHGTWEALEVTPETVAQSD